MGLINPDDMNLMQVIDDPDQVLEAVLAFYEDTGEESGTPEEPQRAQDDRNDDDDRMFYL